MRQGPRATVGCAAEWLTQSWNMLNKNVCPIQYVDLHYILLYTTNSIVCSGRESDGMREGEREREREREGGRERDKEGSGEGGGRK